MIVVTQFLVIDPGPEVAAKIDDIYGIEQIMEEINTIGMCSKPFPAIRSAMGIWTCVTVFWWIGVIGISGIRDVLAETIDKIAQRVPRDPAAGDIALIKRIIRLHKVEAKSVIRWNYVMVAMVTQYLLVSQASIFISLKIKVVSAGIDGHEEDAQCT